jgi:hypothetical protein
MTAKFLKKGTFLLLIVLAFSAFYVMKAWTPSSYDVVLKSLGVNDAGPDFGTARAIRSDEYAMLTPHFQLAVKSGFARAEDVSPYKEDLRNFLAFPIKDWSLVFRPQFWGFFFLDPAHAYSFYFAILNLSCLVGWALLLRCFGLPLGYAAAGSALVFFSFFVQAWWSSNAPCIALAPWLALAFIAPRNEAIRFALVLYAAAAWFFGLLYPPFIYALAVTMAAITWAYRPDLIKPSRVFLAIAAVAIAGIAVYFYMQETISVMRNTIYPGRRAVDGGTAPLMQLVTSIFPYAGTIGFDPTKIAPELVNECEAGTIASFLALTIACFATKTSLSEYLRTHRRALLTIGSVLAATLCWMYLPIPSSVGRFLLLDMVPPRRLLLLFGLLTQLALVHAAAKLQWSLTPVRFVTFAAVACIVPLAVKGDVIWTDRSVAWFDFAIIPLVAAAILAGRWFPTSRGLYLLVACALCNAITFGQFNPLQSAIPIFKQSDFAALADLSRLQGISKNGIAVLSGWYGATLPGLGITAINYTPMRPQIAYLSGLFPSLTSEEKNYDFNRYAHIIPAFVNKPVVDGDKLNIPIQIFANKAWLHEQWSVTETDPIVFGGSADEYSVLLQDDGEYIIKATGWADFLSVDKDQYIEYSGDAVEPVGVTRDLRRDVALAKNDSTMNLAGFNVFLSANSLSRNPHIVLQASDPARGKTRIPNLTTLSLYRLDDLAASSIKRNGRGKVDSFELSADHTKAVIQGWLPVALKEGQNVALYIDGVVVKADLRRVYREDLVKSFGPNWGMSGFLLNVEFKTPINTSDITSSCVVATDPTDGQIRLTGNDIAAQCGAEAHLASPNTSASLVPIIR